MALNSEKPQSLGEYKRRAISIAEQFSYTDKIPGIREKLKCAKSADEISMILCKARKSC